MGVYSLFLGCIVRPEGIIESELTLLSSWADLLVTAGHVFATTHEVSGGQLSLV